MAERVLVTGGTGKTGSLVVLELAKRGVGVSIATRRPSAPDHVRFDWADAATHGPALAGIDAVYLVAPTDRTDQLSVMRPFLERAVAQGIGPLVLLGASSLDEGDPMMGEVHAWLRHHAARWTVLRPSWFMQNFVNQLLPAILAEGRIHTAAEDGRVPFIDAADIAAVAVRALTGILPSGDLLLTGPEALSYDTAANMVAAVAGRPVTHVRLSATELAARYRRLSLPDDYADLLAGMDRAIARGSEDRTTAEVQRLTGRPPMRLAGFLAAHRAILRGD
jgi:uncharacterized protein YbjT (DUF2867 family)